MNSALQRARATLKNKNVTGVDVARPGNGAQEELLNRYVDAFERSDFDALVALLHEDATMSMPPFTWWVRGRGEIYKALLGSDGSCHGSRFVRVYANGQPALGQYTPSGEGGAHRPWALQVIEIVEGQITGITSFLSATDLFPLFDLPAEIDALHGIGKPHLQRFREEMQDDR